MQGSKENAGCKKMHQESENSGKSEYILGHHIGFVALLAGRCKKFFCIPMHGQLHEGVQAIRQENDESTIVSRMAQLVIKVAQNMECSCYAVS
ncbi:hypothetical protein GMMP1_600018 [Candidatus Magnetomoraceae bacterium gMMP-1]